MTSGTGSGTVTGPSTDTAGIGFGVGGSYPTASTSLNESVCTPDVTPWNSYVLGAPGGPSGSGVAGTVAGGGLAGVPTVAPDASGSRRLFASVTTMPGGGCTASPSLFAGADGAGDHGADPRQRDGEGDRATHRRGSAA